MNQIQEQIQPETNLATKQSASIGVKLTLISVSLLLLGFVIYAVISIRIGQGNVQKNLEDSMENSVSETTSQIRAELLEARIVALNFATALENGSYGRKQFLKMTEDTILRNEQIFGASAGYEPYQFQPEIEFWAPSYSLVEDGTLSFNDLADLKYVEQGWYQLPKQTGAPLLLGPYLSPRQTDAWIFTWAVPFKDTSGNFRGVAAIDSKFSNIQNTFADLKFGKSGYAFLIDSKGRIIGIDESSTNLQPMVDSMESIIDSGVSWNWRELTNNMLRGETGFMEASDNDSNPMYIAYGPVGLDTGWSFAVAYPRGEIIQDSNRLQNQLIGYGLLLAIIFGGIIYYFARSTILPLRDLTKIAEQISGGNLQVRAEVDTLDEVGALANTMNRMTVQLQDTLENLERRVTERTVDLEISRRQTESQAAQLFAISDISRIINSEQELDAVLPLIARLVSERLNFDHTGIFLLDDTGQYIVLRAASSFGGQTMLKRGYKLKVGESGVISHVADTGAARIALDVGADAVTFDNPDLPNMRSELALPLRARNKIIGILDVQSQKPGAFTQDDVNTLSILADQVAITLENSRLLKQTQSALEEAQSIYQQNLRTGWASFSQDEGVIGYQQSPTISSKLTSPFSSDEINQAMNRGEVLSFHKDGKTDEPTLVIPVKLREQIIGVIQVKAPTRERQWTNSEINLTEAVSERLSLALENARLIYESQRQVIKEQTIGEITTRISSSTNLENVLLTAVEELGRTIPGSEVTIKLKNEKTEENPNKEQL